MVKNNFFSNRQQVGGHRSREGDGHRHHSALPPPPDPPIIPLSRVCVVVNQCNSHTVLTVFVSVRTAHLSEL